MRSDLRGLRAFVVALSGCLVAGVLSTTPRAEPGDSRSWNPRAAAASLDARQTWWASWPSAQRDHGTFCVSCHTALPYALARPALRSALAERQAPAAEAALVDNVLKRVRMWNEVAPFYPDQTRGIPKTTESRGTESVLNAAILATRDAHDGTLSADGRTALANMWALQMKTGELSGAWAWLNFHYEPWEADASPYFGAALAAVAVGTAPGNYASSAEIQDGVKALRGYLTKQSERQHTLNKLMLLWASGKLPGLLTTQQRSAIADEVFARQQADGGWSASSLGPWKRSDGTAEETVSDGYATGLAAFALQQAGLPSTHQGVQKALRWLSQHQDATGRWLASSLNKRRDPETDAGRFMSDAATAYAVLALTAADAN